ncbi:MAG: S-methyl-5-thioribose-1-phosphate isomerase [Saccharofermentanales bacterium]
MVDTLRWSEGRLSLLDQRELPARISYLEYDTVDGVYEAIRDMVVRGAPAIGVAAAYGMVLAARELLTADGKAEFPIDTQDEIISVPASDLSECFSNGRICSPTEESPGKTKRVPSPAIMPDKTNTRITAGDFLTAFAQRADYLISARPTAVNLEWAVSRMLAAARRCLEHDLSVFVEGAMLAQLFSCLECEAALIQEEDLNTNRAIGEHLLSLLEPGDGVLTHCNAGALATTGYGTATAPFYLALERGIPLRIYVDETRPRQQGARLTAFELQQAGADLVLICDNMAASVMSQGKIQACITGCDRVAANGDTANKIGTLGVAILARHFGIPFYIAAPTSTIDLSCPTGADIPIEERSADEIRLINGDYICPPEVPVYNPGFDVTPADLITAIVTEHGIIYPPFTGKL